MASIAQKIEQEALKLSQEERAALAERLWLSLEPDPAIDKAWALEIERRIKEIDSGAVEPPAHEDVVAELRARYRK